MAIFVEKSENSKISGEKGRVSATYGSIKNTCPNSCELKDAGCYAQYGHTNLSVRRADSLTDGMNTEQAARVEATAIDQSFKGGPIPQDGVAGGRDLRLHVSGDSRTIRAAKILGAAIKRWFKRGGGRTWCYTHAWERVSRDNWGPVSILASIKTPREAEAAVAQGYAPALAVPYHDSDKAYVLPGSKTSWIPCPQQTRDIPCTDCGLCMDADKLRDAGKGILFAIHGPGANKAKRRLEVLAA